jgi:hypothetical protein
MINGSSLSKISFQGNTYRATRVVEDAFTYASDFAVREGKKFSKKVSRDVPSFKKMGVYTYLKKTEGVRLEKKWFGFSTEDAIPLPLYKGIKGLDAGFSTEPEMGDTWLKAGINTPLATSGVHDCAILHCIDEVSGEQVLAHIFPNTSSNTISKFIKNKLKNVTKANILPGDVFQTNSTTNYILDAVNDINPKIKPKFYHFSAENSEVVACNGELSYIPHMRRLNMSDISFKFVDNKPIRQVVNEL